MKAQRTFLISLVMFVLVVVFTACAQVSAEEPVKTERQESEVVVEAIKEEPLTDSAFYAANPELMAADRYLVPAIEQETTSGSTFFAANPELMAVERYTAPARGDELTSDSTIFAANPELMAARRYGSEPTKTESDYLADNPELKVVRRYEAAVE